MDDDERLLSLLSQLRLTERTVTSTPDSAPRIPTPPALTRCRIANQPTVYRYQAPGLSGLTNDWDECKENVTGFPCALHRGYKSRVEAEAAFLYAQQRGWTSSHDPHHFRYIPPIPVTDDDYEVYNPLSGGESDNDEVWYVVYRGLRPGVYRSSLESQLNVTGVPGQVFESIQGEDAARAKFADAKRKGVPAQTVSRNKDYLRRKTREAMSRIYYSIGVDPALHEERQERRRQAAAKYRELNRQKLKLKARERRRAAQEGTTAV
ncbi:unnamed protein product [Mycena citricolor]|uniref:Ribonuclease H1 N-terminal domain-containing protein n=1 Tax=Mycena citricolor TaxID=2018698 RepID=A0AAD2HNP5_9AGAR|nr:unnamed protein product [Mycena citricolor]